jgi:hypothetical protein
MRAAMIAVLVLMAGAVALTAPSALGQQAPVCDDGIDNDGDGRFDAGEDPGCAGDRVGADETDPAPVASSAAVRRAGPWGCGLEVGVEVLPDLVPARLFPFAEVQVTVRGRSGEARSIERSRQLPVAADPGYLFQRLRPGRYDVTATYLGDPFRLRSATAQRSAVLAQKRCEVYFAGTGFRRVRPRSLAIGASQGIFEIRWNSWGGRRARGTGTFPANDCIPYCAAGHITPHRVALTLSRKRVCRGYEEYLSLRYRPLDGDVPRAETVDFSYRC